MDRTSTATWRLGLSLCVAGLLLAGAGCGCGPRPPEIKLVKPDGTTVEKPPAPALEDERAAEAVAREAEALEAAGDTAGAQRKREEVRGRYPGTAAGAAILYVQAREAAAAGDVAGAIAAYEKLLFYRPSFEHAREAREHYAALLVDVGRLDDAISMLGALFRGASADADRTRVGLSLGRALEGADRGKEALRVYVGLRDAAAASSDLRDQLQARCLRVVASGLGFGEAEALWQEIRNDSDWQFLHDAVAFKLAKIYFHTRDFSRSAAMLGWVKERYPISRYAGQARVLHDHLRARFEVNAKAIGVLLPLSGRFQQYGERCLVAIKLALGADTGVELVVRDTRGDATTTSKAVEDLVLEHHVLAIIGPLFSNPAMAAALKAEELSVPLLALSHREGLPQVGPWVFRTGLTVSHQAQALATLAFERLGMSRFAILYPYSRYGADFMQAFWDEVERRKGEIRGAESYEPDQTTFREPVRRLVGRWFMEARPEYREKVAEIRKEDLPPMRLKAELERLEKTLPPVVDFDAIVIPDSGRTIGLIAPALAFEDVVMTRDPRTLERIKKATGREDIQPITLLGASTWNSPQTVDSCENYCEDAIFVDAFYPGSPEPRVRDFVVAFREAAETEPNLTEALAYDTAGLVRHILLSSRPQGRQAMLDMLRRSSYEGVTGKFHFDQTGEAQKELFALTIKERTIKLLEQPEQPPQG